MCYAGLDSCGSGVGECAMLVYRVCYAGLDNWYMGREKVCYAGQDNWYVGRERVCYTGLVSSHGCDMWELLNSFSDGIS